MTFSRLIRIISSVLAFCLYGMLLTSCILISCFLGTREKNISRDPCFAELFGRVYEFKKDVFLYEYRDHDTCRRIDVGLPGVGSDLPYSVEEYENDPKNWHKTGTWAKRGYTTSKTDVLGIVKAGTRFTIDQVVHRTYISGNEINTIYITIIGYDPKGCKIDAGDVFNQFGSEFGEAPSALKDKWVGPVTQ